GQGGALRLLIRYPKVLALCATWVFTSIIMIVLAVFLPMRLDELDIGNTVLVALYGTVLASCTASVIGLGYAGLARRLGYPVLVRAATGSWALAFLVFALAQDPFTLLLVPVLVGIGNGLAMSTMTVLIDDAVPDDQRGTATSLQSSAMFGGQFASPLVFGPVIDATSVTVGASICAVLAGCLCLAFFRLKDAPDPAADPVPGSAPDPAAGHGPAGHGPAGHGPAGQDAGAGPGAPGSRA
ncbi:MFS transporter, partial [Streptomyces boncukensis]